MRRLLSLLFIVALSTSAWAADLVELGSLEEGISVIGNREGLQYNHDGSFENGMAWQLEGIAAPYYGAFGECYDLTGEGMITGITLWLTQIGNFFGQSIDVYVWEGSPPNDNVLAVVPGVVLDNVAFWPDVSEHEIPLDLPVNGVVTVGYWGNWPGETAGFFCATDENGPGGCPWTNVAPGIGFPEGWQHPNVAWPSTVAAGIGVTTQGTTATVEKSWSAINSLY